MAVGTFAGDVQTELPSNLSRGEHGYGTRPAQSIQPDGGCLYEGQCVE